MKIQFNIPVVVLSLWLGALLISCSENEQEREATNKDQPISVTVGIAARQSITGIQVSGSVESKETAVISTRVMGFITSVKVKAGDQVKNGQLLATISSEDILAKKRQAQAMLSEATAAMTDAKRDYERFVELYEQNSASKKEFENVTLHYNSMKAKVEAAQQMQNEAEAMLAYTNLKAPFSGVITQKYVDAGSLANPGMPILVIEQRGNYQVHATVSENDIQSVRQGAPATVTVKSTGQLFRGTVAEVSPSSQFSGGQYNIKVNIPESDDAALYSGMYVNVNIEGVTSKEEGFKIMVPASAIISKDQLNGLYTITDQQTAMLRWIRLGKVHGNYVEILSGLRDDEIFIMSSEGKLFNGAPVTVNKQLTNIK